MSHSESLSCPVRRFLIETRKETRNKAVKRVETIIPKLASKRAKVWGREKSRYIQGNNFSKIQIFLKVQNFQ